MLRGRPQVALLHGRTTLLDVSMEDLVRAANQTLIDLRHFGVTAVTLEQMFAALSIVGDIKKADDLRYFSKVGSAASVSPAALASWASVGS